MEKKKTNPGVQEWGDWLKRKLIYSRILGVICSLLCAGAMVLLYFKIGNFNNWMCTIVICFSMAGVFMANSNIQAVRSGRKWQVVNMLLALLCYAAVVVLVTISMLNGFIALSF